MEVNIIGCGVMASQIAALFYLSGNNVNIWSYQGVDEANLLRTAKLVKRSLAMDSAFKEGSINIISNLLEFKNNITIESVVEDLKVKKNIYNTVGNLIDKPFFTNSSSISPIEIGEKVNGLHFFNPISKIKLVELCLNINSNEEVEGLIAALNSLNFQVANVHNNRGYIANYIIFNEISSLFRLIEIHHYKLEEISKIYNALFNKNLLQTIDIIGVDVTYKILNNLKEVDSGIYLPKILKNAIDHGVYGKKNNTSIINFLKNNNE